MIDLTRTDDTPTFFKELPKIELHAHLNGSLGIGTALVLAESKIHQLNMKNACISPNAAIVGKQDQKLYADVKQQYEMDTTSFQIADFFPLFKLIYALTDTPSAVTFATEQVILEFADDGVVYLELRSTPRRTTGMSKDEYIQAMFAGIEACKGKNLDIIVRVILTIDRKAGLDDALDTIQLAAKYMSEGVVGIDLAGDPFADHYQTYSQAIKNAKSYGLKVTIHFCEIEGTEDESILMLQDADRLGHATFMSERVKKEVFEKNIPIEVCMSSNVICKTVTAYTDHHIQTCFEANHACCISTDDKGIFKCTLSNEYYIASKVLGLDRDQVEKLARSSIDSIFGSEVDKDALRLCFDEFRRKEQL
ncbi:hypothetical protein SmJEL517_g01949 [Synchytrium microbalum]|uniref:Adenosine deaminase domain-containing protein n=1 Tax=Synchytrium microbalum TaxID=1806994 RepID=A0A507CCM1_9FUNG|nr:uncharacterized protein SmJEL517_g01949 [Synchytrium microbalum]TPX35664.1 hypothetical protein SmJEL517_g01949 [Synchytrium microbalum]